MATASGRRVTAGANQSTRFAVPRPVPPSSDCPLFPRLAAFRVKQRSTHLAWFNAPIWPFGDDWAELLVVGLAPGPRRANRTGRPFTGEPRIERLRADLVGDEQVSARCRLRGRRQGRSRVRTLLLANRTPTRSPVMRSSWRTPPRHPVRNSMCLTMPPMPWVQQPITQPE
jgi:uracil-DNA glycosylase